MNRGTHVVLDPSHPRQGPQAKGLVTGKLASVWHLSLSADGQASPGSVPELSAIPREAPEFIIQHMFINACLMPGVAVPGCLRSLGRAAARASDSYGHC